ncbi:TonB-dependent siderophore receptor [Thermoleptolyngbya sp.]
MTNQFCFWVFGVGLLSGFIAVPVRAQGDPVQEGTAIPGERAIAHDSRTLHLEPPDLSNLEQPATTLEEWVAQLEQSFIPVTGVRVNMTTGGLELVLETSAPLDTPSTSVVGNALVAEISNAQLALPDGDEFQQVNPIEGIALISVTSLPANRVRIAITGVDAPPTAELSLTAQGLAVAITPGTEAIATEDEAIQVVVTGEQGSSYAPGNATTATRTDAPLRDIPQSIQVIPRQVVEDQRANRVSDALRNVSGVQTDDSFGGTIDRVNIRGFQADVLLVNGFRRQSFTPSGGTNPRLIERIEVLKGPASVLFGNLEPGGVVNVITESPLSFPQYLIEGAVGSFGFFQPSIDLTGPLTADGNLLYRLNVLYEGSDGFRDYDRNVSQVVVAPSLTWNISDRTSITFDVVYLDEERPFDRGLPAIGDGVADIPRERLLQNSDAYATTNQFSASYRLEHQFNNDWSLRNSFQYLSSDTFDFRLDSAFSEDTGVLARTWRSNDDYTENYALQANIVGNFSTGSIDHTLLFGVDLDRLFTVGGQRRLPGNPNFPINIFTGKPDSAETPDLSDLTLQARNGSERYDSLGFYLQDQISLASNLKLLIGGRFDIFDFALFDRNIGETTIDETFSRFTPRAGIVYQPTEEISLYGSYGQSFNRNFSQTADGSLLDPEVSEQFEVGIRGEFLGGRLITNLAAYELTKQNIEAPDPINPDFSIAIGEIRSRGIELDVAGEILPGWNLIASYAYTDAEVTRAGSFFPEGNRPSNVGEHSGSLWTTYQIQSGDLQGLGAGIGVFFVSDRFGDFDNSYTLPGYLRTDAALYYRRDNWRVALNFQNLFDVNYIRYSEGYREANAPGEPFTIIGSFAITF